MLTKQEKGNVVKIAAKIGEIVGPCTVDRVESTALAEVKKLFTEVALSGQGRLIIGRYENNETIKELCEKGELSIHSVSSLDDGFEIKMIGDDIVVAGANARGVLYGVYELEDRIFAGETEALHIKLVPAFRKRSDALGHYHNAKTFNFGNDVIDERKIEYLARLRINQFCACFDCSPFGNVLSDFVHSDVFPFQKKPSFEAVNTLKTLSRTMSKYGIEFHMMIWEPAVPQRFAPIDKYPKEALGMVRRPWGGGKGNLQHTLCISSPLVQEHYRNIIPKFMKEFPDVKGFFIYNMDGISWICTPELCPTCKEKLIDSDPIKHNPWETQATLISLFSEIAHKEDPDFKINFWGTVHFTEDAVPKMYEAATGYDCVTTGCMGSDHDLMVTSLEKPVPMVQATLDIAKKRGLPAYMYFAYNKLESVQTGFASPFIIAESIKTFKRWGFDCLIEVSGPTPALNQITALTMRQFQSEPDTDEKVWLKALARQQFGADAGEKMYSAWENNYKAMDAWRDHYENPFCGSNFNVRLGLYSNIKGPIPILPDLLDRFNFLNIATKPGLKLWDTDQFKDFFTDGYFERFQKTAHYLGQAEEQARKACQLADDEPVAISYYEGCFEGISRHTHKEYAELNHCSIEMTHSLSVQRVEMLRGIRLLRDMELYPDRKEELFADFLKLMQENVRTLKKYVAMLDRFTKMRPCLSMTGLCENEIQIYRDDAEERIELSERILAENKFENLG